MATVTVDDRQVAQMSALLGCLGIPEPQEALSHTLEWPHGADLLANCYLAVVAICHQTSPIGERQLEGQMSDGHRRGWNYLKEKFLLEAAKEPVWTTPDHWMHLTPGALSRLYEDEKYGSTLARVNERAYLLNGLGRYLNVNNTSQISSVFEECGRRLEGQGGFLEALGSCEAYSDPVRKKSHFFISLACTECGWAVTDEEALLSPVDYHELRGHIRIGTIRFEGELQTKIVEGLVLSEDEDTQIRQAVQRINNTIAECAELSSSALHYFLWNFFRECCMRSETCCASSLSEHLPKPYNAVLSGRQECIFAQICAYAGASAKPTEPPYAGHYY